MSSKSWLRGHPRAAETLRSTRRPFGRNSQPNPRRGRIGRRLPVPEVVVRSARSPKISRRATCESRFEVTVVALGRVVNGVRPSLRSFSTQRRKNCLSEGLTPAEAPRSLVLPVRPTAYRRGDSPGQQTLLLGGRDMNRRVVGLPAFQEPREKADPAIVPRFDNQSVHPADFRAAASFTGARLERIRPPISEGQSDCNVPLRPRLPAVNELATCVRTDALREAYRNRSGRVRSCREYNA